MVVLQDVFKEMNGRDEEKINFGHGYLLTEQADNYHFILCQALVLGKDKSIRYTSEYNFRFILVTDDGLVGSKQELLDKTMIRRLSYRLYSHSWQDSDYIKAITKDMYLYLDDAHILFLAQDFSGGDNITQSLSSYFDDYYFNVAERRKAIEAFAKSIQKRNRHFLSHNNISNKDLRKIIEFLLTILK